MKHNLWLALEEFENLLDVESTYPRMLKQMRKREADSIEIVSYKDLYKNDFKKLNKEWIEESFTMEEKDIKVLDNPQELIINKGGAILVALYESKAIAVCSLIKLNDSKYDFELAKMVVEKEYQRKGIGFMLANVAIDKAKELGAKSIFIETNVVLTPAMSMYKKLGFQQVMNYQSDYERSNYAMELIL
ncbi:GNAT family N-acetyltransferase [Sulfurimonas sp.]|uniref:GNAT family N-acetyltransferase n=1 Tax=Sulfurimonas sp. TaxID=2022749 RepID=UPI0025E4703A|nr:GNAT family N-acetyltransferase [Sulfurimonas sp.]